MVAVGSGVSVLVGASVGVKVGAKVSTGGWVNVGAIG